MIKDDRRTMEVKALMGNNPKNDFYGMSQAESQSLWTELYAKGAVNVLANGLSGFAGRFEAQFTASRMIVELPADKSARKAIFEIYNRTQVPRGYKEAKDVGQKYLRIYTDPKVAPKSSAALPPGSAAPAAGATGGDGEGSDE